MVDYSLYAAQSAYTKHMIRDILYQDYRIMAEKSPIQEFFKGRSVLITGVTGFVGKVLLQKLLISCPSLREVFVLMRPKFNNSIQKRLSKMLNLLVSVNYNKW